MRGGDLYLPWRVRHCLQLLAKASKGKVMSDAIASDVLEAWLQREHPQVWQFVLEQEKRELDQVELMTPPEQQKKAKPAKVKKAEPEIEDNFPDAAWEKQA